MNLSIIIVNWNVKELLNRCLHSIFFHLKGQEFEVIVVDNASQDGSVEMIKQKFPQVKLIVNSENCGFAKACNQGVKRVHAKYLLFLNPDSEVTNNLYEQIINFMESHPEVGVGGCYLYYPDGRTQTSFYRFTSLMNHLGRAMLLYSFLPKNRLTSPFFSDYITENESIDSVCGGAMVVRQKAFEKEGLFDESFFLYCEDEDLCYRLRQQGWKIAPIPGTRIIHYHNQSSKKNIRKVTFSSYQSKLFLYSKFHPLHKVIIFRMIQLVGALMRSLFWFFKLATGEKQGVAKQKFLGYLSILLSDFHCRKSLLNKSH
jgi:GT2 family glycosyltransferase